RFEFFNPGSLPKDLKDILKEDFSHPRNPTVAKIFRFIQLSETIGNGFHKMIDGWKSYYQVEPDIKGSFDYYTITFPVVQKTVEKTVEKILQAIREHPKISIREMQIVTGLTRRGVEWNLRKLKSEGIIKRVGPAKGGHWEVIDK
ncbi:MAG: winged helix-turn-helix transcriptional regulator, partial [Thermoplasmatales archaeon]|nr:winged helix-turn-helix transcriptional regulator [Thermoplasmatales archaeon]